VEALLGIDLGTSSVKCVLVSETGQVLAAAQREYPICTPRPGWAEQEPQAWWQATADASAEEVERLALDDERIKASIEGRRVRKVVVVGHKLVNVVAG